MSDPSNRSYPRPTVCFTRSLPARHTVDVFVAGGGAEGGHVRHVVCSAPSGLFAVRAGAYVDATGNGDTQSCR